MIRTQISLAEHQHRRLLDLAAERGVSMAALIREAVQAVLDDEDADRRHRVERALANIGGFRGDGSAVSKDHDHLLAEAYHRA